jgi:hypothetical protein
MFEGLKNFIENLQTANESRKKRWLLFLSALAMVTIIGLWLIYINSDMIANSEINLKQSSWQIFKTGAKTIISRIKDFIEASRIISIEFPKK